MIHLSGDLRSVITYPLPKFEQQKTEVLQRYRILNGSESYDADQTAHTAALVFGTPIVLATLNARYRDWFRSSHGVDPDDLDRLLPFCAHANLADEVFIVADARADEHFASDPAVTSSPHIVFFAGAPLRDPDGKRLGTLCLIDNKPHPFTAADLNILESFAGLVSQDICLRSAGRYAVHDLIDAEEDKCTLYDLAMTDPLTKTLNRRSFFRFTEREVRLAKRYRSELAILMLDIDHFKTVNDVHGHAVGDDVLVALIKTVSGSIREEDLVGRLGGEEFAIVLLETGQEQAETIANRIREDVKALKFDSEEGRFNITISVGISETMDTDTDIVPALERSDKALYEAKRSGRDRVVTAPFGWQVKAATPNS